MSEIRWYPAGTKAPQTVLFSLLKTCVWQGRKLKVYKKHSPKAAQSLYFGASSQESLRKKCKIEKERYFHTKG